MGESVSFGRFTTESLAWEKWSTFSQNQNRYVEEAERFSKPGSVAQKKAFFEQHYKKLAAQKAAALLEQARIDEAESEKPQVVLSEENAENSNVESTLPQTEKVNQFEGVVDNDDTKKDLSEKVSGKNFNLVCDLDSKYKDLLHSLAVRHHLIT